MRWVAKAGVQRAISALPNSTAVNYHFQRRVTKGLPRSDAGFLEHARKTMEHLSAHREHGDEPDTGRIRCFEFGAGWDLISALVFHALGVNHQTLVDIQSNLRFEAVNAALDQCRRYWDTLEEDAQVPLRPLPARIDDEAGLERLGVRYLAPCDARDVPLADDSIDLVTSTFTLEHIPRDDIAAILVESRRLLRPAGLVSSHIDMKDHYSYFQPSLSPYNFLRYSDRAWRLFNSDVHFQNRLRHSDHVALTEQAGFEVVMDAVSPLREEDRAALAPDVLAERFRTGYSVEDLGARETHLVGRVPDGDGGGG